jgi:hypothetical protein
MVENKKGGNYHIAFAVEDIVNVKIARLQKKVCRLE